MRVTLWKLLVAGTLLGLAGAAAVVFGGLYNVSARKGHFPGVSWVLHTTFNNSVDLRAPPPGKTPNLNDPDLIALGAGHYATACAACHATPDRARTATMRAMVPSPPPITKAAAPWTPEELWWIVYNGVKMSGMPAWPATREDEVWAVVAWLEALNAGRASAIPQQGPEDEDGAKNDDMVTTDGQSDDPTGGQKDQQRTASLVAYCSTCHGQIDRHVPELGLQSEAYLLKALRDYRGGLRPSGFMEQAATAIPESALAELAAHFAAAPPPAPRPTEWEGADLALGENLARSGTDDVPACTACHGPGAERQSDHPAGFPVLAGQDRDYLRAQLKVWRDGLRGGSGRAELMTDAAQDLTDTEIDAISGWYASLTLDPRAAEAETDRDAAGDVLKDAPTRIQQDGTATDEPARATDAVDAEAEPGSGEE